LAFKASGSIPSNILSAHHFVHLILHRLLSQLVQAWRDADRGVEVVSEFELLAARAEGLGVDRVLVNGVGKHHWLARHSCKGLRVNFDSLGEVAALVDRAREDEWRVGLRIHAEQEHDPDEPAFGGQFGLTAEECGQASELLRSAGLVVECVHFHLRSNVEAPSIYGLAIKEIRDICSETGLSPRYLDCGGGIPAPGERTDDGQEREFDVSEFFRIIQDECRGIDSLEEVWLENGRFISSRAGVLVVTVLDCKERPDGRYLICDGGRTNHALVSDWGRHALTNHPPRVGEVRNPTTVCGPTCMAFDHLCRAPLPRDIEVGDRIIWHNAGAYHLPWETRFCHGLAPVVWHESGTEVSVVRKREPFEDWWAAFGAQEAR
jgi:diaminopimelate decarboxylase